MAGYDDIMRAMRSSSRKYEGSCWRKYVDQLDVATLDQTSNDETRYVIVIGIILMVGLWSHE